MTFKIQFSLSDMTHKISYRQWKFKEKNEKMAMRNLKMFKRNLNIWPTEYWKLHILDNREYGNFKIHLTEGRVKFQYLT